MNLNEMEIDVKFNDKKTGGKVGQSSIVRILFIYLLQFIFSFNVNEGYYSVLKFGP
jgi:hypothetical protein